MQQSAYMPSLRAIPVQPLLAPELGDLGVSTQQLTSTVGSGITSASSILLTAGAVTGPVGAAIAAVGVLVGIIGSLFKPDLNKIAATNDANSIEPILKNNLHNWLTLKPEQKTVSVQTAALANFDAAWAKLQQLCAQVPGSAGQKCISDRVPGSCAYHVAQPYGWINGQFVPSGPNDPHGQYCWDWGYYRDSIAQDPNVIPDPVASSVIANAVESMGDVSVGGMQIPVALLAAGFLLAALL
ncbi:MAG: hypothetical protein U0Q18_25395 [Bryobacteraceae bacterium]